MINTVLNCNDLIYTILYCTLSSQCACAIICHHSALHPPTADRKMDEERSLQSLDRRDHLQIQTGQTTSKYIHDIKIEIKGVHIQNQTEKNSIEIQT